MVVYVIIQVLSTLVDSGVLGHVSKLGKQLQLPILLVNVFPNVL
jgi:hypothetical protein